jgi:hypothetical protein
MAASPQPPSLQLPKPVRDLTATRIGDQVSLHWTTSRETTDRLKIKVPVQVQICRQLSTTPCEPVATIAAAPGKPADYADTLPPALTAGRLNEMTYTVMAVNKHGRSAGQSNVARTLAGQAPMAVESLSADMSERGVVLHWQAIANLPPNTSIQLQRTLLTSEASNGKTRGGLPTTSEPIEQTFQVVPIGSKDTGEALDSSAVFDRKYRYVAERVARFQVATGQLQAASGLSVPVIIYTRDTFPPAAPIGLVAIPVSAAINDGKPEVDLSWSANTEPDLTQYLIYRRNSGAKNSAGQLAAGISASEQIAPENSVVPIVVPAFRDVQVQAGRTYTYSVVAVDKAGNRSAPSAEVVVTVPSS